MTHVVDTAAVVCGNAHDELPVAIARCTDPAWLEQAAADHVANLDDGATPRDASEVVAALVANPCTPMSALLTLSAAAGRSNRASVSAALAAKVNDSGTAELVEFLVHGTHTVWPGTEVCTHLSQNRMVELLRSDAGPRVAYACSKNTAVAEHSDVFVVWCAVATLEVLERWLPDHQNVLLRFLDEERAVAALSGLVERDTGGNSATNLLHMLAHKALRDQWLDNPHSARLCTQTLNAACTQALVYEANEAAGLLRRAFEQATETASIGALREFPATHATVGQLLSRYGVNSAAAWRYVCETTAAVAGYSTLRAGDVADMCIAALE